MIEYGYERDSLARTTDSIRWWVYLDLDGLRDAHARRGVVDRGFRFARGGRVATEEDAQDAIRGARDDARAEIAIWRTQPSHMLGPAGQLIPLDTVLGEIGR